MGSLAWRSFLAYLALHSMLCACKGPTVTKTKIEYNLAEAETRNIIFVGKSRSGKTTLINVLKDKDHNPAKMKLLRSTKRASLASFTMSSSNSPSSDVKNLHFNIMDTPGLFEITANKTEQRTNEVILETIRRCIDMEITKINHVYFVMSIESGLDSQDIEAFHNFSRMFVGMHDKISVIISFSQTVDEEEEQHYFEQFRSTPSLKEVYDKVGHRIFFLGAVVSTKYFNIEQVQQNVYRQRAALFAHITSQRDTFSVKQLAVYQEHLAFLRQLQSTVNDCCEDRQSCIDPDEFDRFLQLHTPGPEPEPETRPEAQEANEKKCEEQTGCSNKVIKNNEK